MSEASVVNAALATALEAVTKSWKEAKRQADRDDRVSRRELAQLRRAVRREEWSIKEAAYHVMEQAYLKASDNGRLPANARQVMYAARPLVLKLTQGNRVEIWKNSSYFTQHLLPDYMTERRSQTSGWDVVFDARGHFREPHTEHQLGVGTLEVRRYIGGWFSSVATGVSTSLVDRVNRVGTSGPANRYGAVLFIEKEGFDPLWERVDLADRFDLAIMSTKGMSVTAARSLVESLSKQGIPIYVLRDFDKAGFSIVHTLRTDTRRYTFRGGRPNVIDLGLRLTDVQDMDLESEPVDYGGSVDPRHNLRASGATEEECDYLVKWQSYGGWEGQRVELNAMDSRQLVDWLEGKLRGAGVVKVIPDDDTLAAAYQRARRLASVRGAIEAALDESRDREFPVPDDLRVRIGAALERHAGRAWDDVVANIADDDEEVEEAAG